MKVIPSFYRVVVGVSYDELCDKVMIALKEGWHLQGGIAYNPSTGYPSQAMIHYQGIDPDTGIDLCK